MIENLFTPLYHYLSSLGLLGWLNAGSILAIGIVMTPILLGVIFRGIFTLASLKKGGRHAA